MLPPTITSASTGLVHGLGSASIRTGRRAWRSASASASRPAWARCTALAKPSSFHGTGHQIVTATAPSRCGSRTERPREEKRHHCFAIDVRQRQLVVWALEACPGHPSPRARSTRSRKRETTPVIRSECGTRDGSTRSSHHHLRLARLSACQVARPRIVTPTHPGRVCTGPLRRRDRPVPRERSGLPASVHNQMADGMNKLRKIDIIAEQFVSRPVMQGRMRYRPSGVALETSPASMALRPFIGLLGSPFSA